MMEYTTSSNGAVQLFASPAGQYSLEISDCDGVDGTTTARVLKLGLAYGGTETIGKYAGANANVSQVQLYVGSELRGTSYIGTQESGKVIFEWSAGSEAQIAKGNAIVSL